MIRIFLLLPSNILTYVLIGCGKTKKMTQNFVVSIYSKHQMVCTADRPCYCYGKICLVSNKGNCYEGYVFIDGRPFCGAGVGWNKRVGRAICQELGFRNVESTITGSRR